MALPIKFTELVNVRRELPGAHLCLPERPITDYALFTVDQCRHRSTFQFPRGPVGVSPRQACVAEADTPGRAEETSPGNG